MTIIIITITIMIIKIIILLLLHSRLQPPTGRASSQNLKAPAGKTAQ